MKLYYSLIIKKDHLTKLVYTFESVLLNVIEWYIAFIILVSISPVLNNAKSCKSVSPFLLMLYDIQKDIFKILLKLLDKFSSVKEPSPFLTSQH